MLINDYSKILDRLKGKKVLVTGVCGTVGQSLLKRLLELEIDTVVGVDINETALFFLKERYKQESVKLYLCDICDTTFLKRITEGVDIVFHAAALKHVGICEEVPEKAIQTNLNGIVSILNVAFENKIKRVLFTSSDKAVSATNAMGASKLLGEKIISAQKGKGESGPICASVRFGNIMDSNGSVLTIFRKQIAEGGPVTVTHKDMTRYIMSQAEATELIIKAALLCEGGEVFVMKMPLIKITDLAELMIKHFAADYNYSPDMIDVVYTGVRRGESLTEELLTEEEMSRSVDFEDFIVIYPTLNSFEEASDSAGDIESYGEYYLKKIVSSIEELEQYMDRMGLLPGKVSTGV